MIEDDKTRTEIQYKLFPVLHHKDNPTFISHKSRVFKFSVVFFVLFVFFAVALGAPVKGQSTVPTAQFIVVSPPQIVLDEIYSLEKTGGTFTPENGSTVISDHGTVSIMNTTIEESVLIVNMSTQPSPYEFKIVNELGKNTTTAFLNNTNGYLYKVTNSKGQVTGRVNNYTINVPNGAAILTEYPLLYTASYVFTSQISPDSIPPPPGQNYSVDQVSNHTSELLQGASGDDIAQVWFNVTLIWKYSSSGTPEVINLWMNGTCEAPSLWNGAEWYETHLVYGFEQYMFWGGTSVYSPTYSVQVNPPAYDWVFTTNTSNESSQLSPFGHYIFDNDTLDYYDALMTPTPYTEVWIAQM